MTRQTCKTCGYPLDSERDITHFKICIPKSQWPDWLRQARPVTVQQLQAEVNAPTVAVLEHIEAGPQWAKPPFSEYEPPTAEVSGTRTLIEARPARTEPPLPQPERLVKTVTELVACALDGCTYIAQNEKALASHRRFAKQHKAVTDA
jgi:hypothetical protein